MYSFTHLFGHLCSYIIYVFVLFLTRYLYLYISIYIFTSIVKPQLNSPIDKMGMFLPQQMEDLLQNRWSIHGVTYIHFTQKMWMVASMECL